MRIIQFRMLITFSIVSITGCTSSPTSTPVSIATQAMTEPSVLEFQVEDVPGARSLSLAVAPDEALYLIYGEGHSLFVSHSTDGGQTFGEPVLATGDVPVHVLPIERPAIAADANGRVAIAWLEMPPDFHGANVWYAVSGDSGETFTPGALVATEPEGEVAMVEVALDREGNPLLAWLNDSELKFSRSRDGGATFTEAMSIGTGSCECCQPQIRLTDGTVHIAYRSLEPGNEQGDIRDIVMIHSRDDGETFTPIRRVSDAHWYLPACPIAGPSLGVADDQLYVAWMDGRHEPAGIFSRGDIWLAKSEDGGEAFSPNVRINPDQEMHHTLPSVAVGPGGRIHVAWEAQAQETRDAFLYYTTSDDGGQTFAPPHIIADNTDATRGNPGKPVLVVDPAGRVTLAWLDRQGGRLATWIDTK
ncbi:MAG TPA: sialidase family protein [Anaerolineales bacterium]|nr:sialidase family protein [Anaerolineales bacterium]